MENNEKLYIKGFNNGYLIAEHEPELANQLVKHPNTHSDYFKGFVSGKKEFEMEKIKRHVLGMPQNNLPLKEVKNIGKKR